MTSLFEDLREGLKQAIKYANGTGEGKEQVVTCHDQETDVQGKRRTGEDRPARWVSLSGRLTESRKGEEE